MNADAIVNSDEKRCSRCGLEQAIDSFQWKNRARGIRRTWCRSCARAYSHQHYLDNIDKYKAKARRNGGSDRRRIRVLVDEYLRAHPCVDCGASDIAILEFDHRDPATKRESVSRLVMTTTWGPILREIEKCDVRCANCHRQRTARQFNWAKLNAMPMTSPAPVPLPAARAPSDPGFLRACIWCQQLKPLSAFAFKNAASGTLNSHCRKCHAAYRRKHYRENRSTYFRQAIAQTRRKMGEAKARLHGYLLEHACIDCGETNVAALDFDHVDPSTKETTVSQLTGRRTWNAIRREMDKCVVRCANCHRKRTIDQARAPNATKRLVQSAAARE
jgi:hypothetical protein